MPTKKRRVNNFRIAKINGKWKLKVPQTRLQQWANDWEKKRLDALYVEAKKGDVVYYVGAEAGDMPALLQSWGAQLYLFEPNHTAWPVIRGIFDANKLDRPVGLYAMFVGAETELEPKNPDKDLYGGEGWKLAEDNWPNFSKGEIGEICFSNLSQEKDGLPVVTIDDVVSILDPLTGVGTKIPDIISIDVEGSEMEVLKGAEGTIETFKPKIFLSLHPEFVYEQYGLYARSVRDWIIDKGYTETLLDYQHEVHLLYKPIPEKKRKK